MNSKKRILRGTKVYLAGNLEYATESHARGWRDYLAEELKKIEIKTLDPTTVVFEGQPHETEEVREWLKLAREEERYDEVVNYMVPVVQKDLRQIDLSDFIIFNISVDSPTFGTIHELVIAIQQKKPVFICVGDKKKTPLWLLGIVPHHYFYNSVDEILEKIKQINSGEEEIDSARWRLLIDELR
jgi:nucleoside 2-deoxyribosyltransferase